MPDDPTTAAPKGASRTPKTTLKELNEIAREQLLLFARRPELYESYLSTVAKFPSYSAMNAVSIHTHAPGAARVCDMNAWNKLGCSVKAGAHGIPITIPERAEKSAKTFFKVKYLFSDQDVKGAPKGRESYDQAILEQAFEAAEAPAPVGAEGAYIVGTHFGLPGAGELHPSVPEELLAAASPEEAFANIKAHVDDVRRSAATFVRAVESAYRGLERESAKERSSELFQSLKGPDKAPAQTRAARAGAKAPTRSQAPGAARPAFKTPPPRRPEPNGVVPAEFAEEYAAIATEAALSADRAPKEDLAVKLDRAEASAKAEADRADEARAPALEFEHEAAPEKAERR